MKVLDDDHIYIYIIQSYAIYAKQKIIFTTFGWLDLEMTI